VTDTGRGIAADMLPHAFELFVQERQNLDRSRGGLGLGLAIVRNLVALHGGRVEVRSEGLGRGSEFIVHLPNRLLAPEGARIEEPHHGAANASAVRRDRLLVVDDNRDAAESLGLVLRFMGYEVSIAYSGAEALELAAHERPRAAIIDIGMPGMSGHELARRMRREAWGRHAVLVALTGWGQEADKQAALAAGFDDHLTKPVDPDTVEALLAKRLDEPAPHGGIEVNEPASRA